MGVMHLLENGVRTVTIQRERPGQSAQIPSKVRSRRTLELRAAELELVADLKFKTALVLRY